MSGQWEFWIDRGGTFTDVIGVAPDGRLRVRKVPSATARDGEPDPGLEAARAMLAEAGAAPSEVGIVKVGTTVVTNALLEGHGSRVAWVTTRGFGDALLMQGSRRPIELLRRDPNFLVLTEDFGEGEAPLSPQAWIVLALTAAAVVVPALGLLPIAETTFAAAVLMVLLGCLTMEEAYAAVEWRSIFLIAGMLPVGIALTNTGAAALIGEQLVHVIGGSGPLVLAGGLFAFTVAMTQIIGGQVTPVVLAPIAIAAAEHIGLGVAGVRGIAMVVALGCSTAFLTPMSHSVNLLVMGPGAYRFNDYRKLGIPLTIVLLIVLLAGLALIWGL